MLNYVAAQIVLFGLRSDFLRQEGSDQPISKVLSDFVRIPQILDLPAIRLHWGFVVALIMAVIVSWFLFKTTKGFELRAAGFNMTAARYAGMSASGSIILAMSISGGLAGLGGSMEVLGTVPQMSNDISSGYGFNAIALALLAGNRPVGIVIAALLFGALRTGGGLMQVKTGIPLDLLFFIQALVIMFVAAPGAHPGHLARRPAQEGDGRARHAGRRRRNPTRRRLKGAPHDRGRRPPSASTPSTRTPARHERARRSARIRGVILAALGLFAFQLAISTMETTAKFSFWIDKQGGTPFQLQTTVGAPVDRDRPRDRRDRASGSSTAARRSGGAGCSR